MRSSLSGSRGQGQSLCHLTELSQQLVITGREAAQLTGKMISMARHWIGSGAHSHGSMGTGHAGGLVSGRYLAK